MNNHNIRYWEQDGCLHAEWGELSLDDEDRDLGILIEVSTPLLSEERLTKKKVRTLLCKAYDDWMDQRGG